jgi:ParB family transcriptional regulator, chromosome partitioning protein
MAMENIHKKRGLGKGLGALISDVPSPELLAQSSRIAISKIRPNRFQPRKRFSQEELASLTESVRREGVLAPVLLRPVGDGYELIAGERRWRASQAAGLKDIPAVVREVDDLQALELAIVENEQRDNLTAIESARAYQLMMAEFGCTQQQVAERIGRSRTQVTNLLRLLQLPEKVQKMVDARELDMGHARPLVGLQETLATQLAEQCAAHGWSARQMEAHAKKAAAATQKKLSSKAVDADVAALQDELTRRLGLVVEIVCRKNGGGEMRIRYSKPAELDGVLTRLRA